MAAENNDCGLGCKLNKLINSIFHHDEPVNPNTGRLSSRYSAGTGWKYEKGNQQHSIPSENRTIQQAINLIRQMGIINPSIDIQVSSIIIPPCNCTSNSIIIDKRVRTIAGPTSIPFQFGNIGAIAHYFDNGKRIPDETNRINPLVQSQQENLRAVAQYLITHPQATVRFQYPGFPTSVHPKALNDIRAVYGMSFRQITNFLKKQGVNNLDKRVLRSSGTDFDVILKD